MGAKWAHLVTDGGLEILVSANLLELLLALLFGAWPGRPSYAVLQAWSDQHNPTSQFEEQVVMGVGGLGKAKRVARTLSMRQ